MTEEIIEVNGLNVTECTHLSDCLLCDYTENHSQFCSDYENCYYKQLKRLEQENKMIINEYNKLQAEIIGDMEFKEIMLTGITPLKVLQNLKERNRELQAFYDVHESFKTDFDINRKLLDTYRSALEEIREMTKKYDADVGDTIIANPIQDCYDIYCKINEVLE